MMKKLLSALAVVVLAASFALPLNAAPIFVPKAEQVQTGDVVQVKRRHHRHWRSDRYWNRRYAYRSCRYYGNCYLADTGTTAILGTTAAILTITATTEGRESASILISSQ